MLNHSDDRSSSSESILYRSDSLIHGSAQVTQVPELSSLLPQASSLDSAPPDSTSDPIVPLRHASPLHLWHYSQPSPCRPYVLPKFDHAAPSSDLSDRDLAALAQLFDRHDMAEVTEDLDQVLSYLLPAPCWEDEDISFFLKD